jgi:hypothetical protein
MTGAYTLLEVPEVPAAEADLRALLTEAPRAARSV